jgi:hypothetical protein
MGVNDFIDNGCSLVGAQLGAVGGEVAVILDCKSMVETMRRSGKFKNETMPADLIQAYGYTVVCVTPPGAMNLNFVGTIKCINIR